MACASSDDSTSEDSDEDGFVSKTGRALLLAERKRVLATRPAGCGEVVVRNFVAYHGDTYKATNPAGRHVTTRRCPTCVAPGPAVEEVCTPMLKRPPARPLARPLARPRPTCSAC